MLGMQNDIQLKAVVAAEDSAAVITTATTGEKSITCENIVIATQSRKLVSKKRIAGEISFSNLDSELAENVLTRVQIGLNTALLNNRLGYTRTLQKLREIEKRIEPQIIEKNPERRVDLGSIHIANISVPEVSCSATGVTATLIEKDGFWAIRITSSLTIKNDGRMHGYPQVATIFKFSKLPYNSEKNAKIAREVLNQVIACMEEGGGREEIYNLVRKQTGLKPQEIPGFLK